MKGFDQKYRYGILLFLSVFPTFPFQVLAQSGLHSESSTVSIAFQTASPIVNKLKPSAQTFYNASEKTSNSSGTIFLSRLLFHRNSNSSRLKSKNANKDDGSRKKFSFSKTGGRSQSISRKKTTDKSRGGIISVVEKVIPALLFLASGFLFFANSSVVYYDFSVFEKTINNEKGEREHFRRESFRSNVPSMISDDRLMKGTAIDRYNDETNSIRFLDRELRDLEREKRDIRTVHV